MLLWGSVWRTCMWILGLRGRSLNVSMIYILHTTIHTFPKVVMRIYLTIEILMISFFQLQSLRGKEQTAFLYTHATIKKSLRRRLATHDQQRLSTDRTMFFFSTDQSWCLLKFWYTTGGPGSQMNLTQGFSFVFGAG